VGNYGCVLWGQNQSFDLRPDQHYQHCRKGPTRCFQSEVCSGSKAGHEPARAGLGASQHLARCKWARLGLARFAKEPENWARPELAYGSVQLDQAREP
jgi:hypothetical protein